MIVLAMSAALSCADVDLDSAKLGVQQMPARPGSTLRLGASSGPWGMEAVPSECLTDWRVSDPSVSLSHDHRTLTVGPDAVAGRTVEISALAGGRRIGVSVRIVGRDEIALTGFWKQTDVDCGASPKPSEPIRELRFRDDGRYAVTVVPFETREDYWGPMSFDPPSGTIAFEIENANSRYEGVDLTGRARAEGDQTLILEDVFLGDARSAEARSCRYTFARQ